MKVNCLQRSILMDIRRLPWRSGTNEDSHLKGGGGGRWRFNPFYRPSWVDRSCVMYDEVDHSNVPSAKLDRTIVLRCYHEMLQPLSLPGYQAALIIASGTCIRTVTQWTVLADQWLFKSEFTNTGLRYVLGLNIIVFVYMVGLLCYLRHVSEVS
jgi:hypothetical protein